MGVAERFLYVCAGQEKVLDDSAVGNADVAGWFDCFQSGLGICAVYLYIVLSNKKGA